jgi:hypothetical protein
VVHISKVFTSGGWLVANLASRAGQSKFDLAMARADHDAAAALLSLVIDAVQTGETDELAERVKQIDRDRERADDAIAHTEDATRR